jgi:hypothetical protein
MSEAFDRGFDPSADLDRNGIDLNRLRRNLELTLEERVARNYQAAERLLECQRAAKAARIRTPDPSV